MTSSRLPRTKRMIRAELGTPRAIAGSTRYRTLVPQPPAGGRKPDDGSQPRFTANTTISDSPSQKLGTAAPSITRPKSRPRRYDVTPRALPRRPALSLAAWALAAWALAPRGRASRSRAGDCALLGQGEVPADHSDPDRRVPLDRLRPEPDEEEVA